MEKKIDKRKLGAVQTAANQIKVNLEDLNYFPVQNPERQKNIIIKKVGVGVEKKSQVVNEK